MTATTHDAKEELELLLATPEGRRYMLSLTVDAEEGDEADLFAMMAAAVGDSELRRMLEQHKADEARHAGLFRGCLERNGAAWAAAVERARALETDAFAKAQAAGAEHVLAQGWLAAV